MWDIKNDVDLMLKITKHFLCNSFVGCSALAFSPLLAFSQQPNEVHNILRLTPSAGEYRGKTFEKVITPVGSVPFLGDYRLKAQVALQQESAQQVVETLRLNWASSAEVAPDGWHQNEGTWRWSAGPKKSQIEFPIALPNQREGQHPLAITNFDEMWFDYRDRGGSDNCDFGFTTEASSVEAHESSKTILITSKRETASLRPTLSLQAAKDVWLPMDRAYRLKRRLNMDFDNHWRNQQVGVHTQLQKRLHRNLDGIEAVDFLFKSEADIESITLRVAHDKWFKFDTMLNWDVIPRQIESTPDGLVRVRLRLGEWLRKKNNEGDGVQNFFLTEAIVLLKGQAIELVISRPLHEIVFLENQIEPTSTHSLRKQNVSLPNSSTLLAPGYNRWILDLRPLNQENWSDLHLKNALLAMRPGNPDHQCSLEPISLRLVSLANENEPINIADVRRWLRKFGGPFNVADHEKEEVEWAEIDAYIPWSLLPVSSVIQKNSIDVQILDLPEWGLSFQEKSGSIEISWELFSIATHASSTLFLRVPKESKNINSGKARIDFNDGSSSTINFLPNRPIPLGVTASGKHAKKVTLHLKTDKSSGTLVIQELALFRPFLISQTDSFSERRPGWEFLPLWFEPNGEKKGKMSGLGKLVMYGVAQQNSGPSNILFTPVNIASKNLSKIRIDYKLSELPQKPCWLTLRAHTTNKQVSFDLCPSGTEGELNQSLAPLMKKLESEDTVIYFEFEVKTTHALVPVTFEIQAQLGASSLPSIRELFEKNVSVKVGQRSYLPLAIQSVDIKDVAISNRGWLDFGKINLLLGQKPNIDPVFSHPYIKVQKLMLEDNRPLTAADMSQLYPSEKNQPARPNRLIKLALLLLLGAAAWLLWQRGIWQKTWEAIYSQVFKPEKYLGDLVRKLCLRIVNVKTLLEVVVSPVAIFMILSIFTLALYVFGLLLRSGQVDNYFFTFGGIFVVFSWRALLICSRERLVRYLPSLSEKIYGGKSTIYFTGALAGLSVTAALLALNLELVAEQVAIVVYYFLVTGTILQIVELRRANKVANG
jgi:hypothetical protein